MKRCRFGLAVLVGILILGLISGAYLDKICRSASRELTLAAQSPAPEKILRQTYSCWQEHRLLCAILCDHTALEAIGEQFRILDPDSDNFRESCLRLAAKFQALGQAQQLSWENVF